MSMESPFQRRVRGALTKRVRSQSHVSSSHAQISRSVRHKPMETVNIEVPEA